MAIGRRAHIAIRRHLLHAVLCAGLLALCVCCCAIASSTAPAAALKSGYSAKGASSHTSSPPARLRKRRGCARRASFHDVGTPNTKGRTRHARHLARCRHRSHHRRASHRRAAPRHTGAGPLPQNGPCANTQLAPSDANLSLVRAAMLCLVNRERTSRGEAALRPNVDLRRAAQSHSSDMANASYFAHESRNGETPLARMRAAGYIFSSRLGYAVGENIAWGTMSLATPKAIVAGWMASPEHRANMLDATFRDTGVGVAPHPPASLAHGEAGAIYTQDFGRIIRP